MKYLTLNKINNNKYQVIFSNNKYIGDFVRDVDGYFYFWPESNNGAWSEYSLIEIGEKLRDLNKEWDEEIKKIN